MAFYTNIIVEPRITAPQTKPCFIAVECPDAIASGINSRNDTLTWKNIILNPKINDIKNKNKKINMSKRCLKGSNNIGQNRHTIFSYHHSANKDKH